MAPQHPPPKAAGGAAARVLGKKDVSFRVQDVVEVGV